MVVADNVCLKKIKLKKKNIFFKIFSKLTSEISNIVSEYRKRVNKNIYLHI